MVTLTDRLLAVLQEWPAPSGYWVAFSGGCDSSVLLHILSRIESELPATVRALHVHHGLLPGADRWAEHCLSFSNRLAVHCDVLRVAATPAPGESPEAKARKARYAALAAYLPQRSMLLTAHHRDDQAETVLLQLLRGAGPAGLAGMAALAERDHGWLGRPLLEVKRADLRAYALGQGFDWIEDPSNADTSLDRNYLRCEVMPLLRARWPGLDSTFARSADHCAAAARLADATGEQLLACAAVTNCYRLPVAYLLEQSADHQAVLLRHWLAKAKLPIPDTNRLRRLVTEVAFADVQAMPVVSWPGAEVRRYRGTLYAMPPLPALPEASPIAWPSGRALELPGELGSLVLGKTGLALDESAVTDGKLNVRFRCEGVAATPVLRQGRRSFKRICQDWGVPPWLRHRIPLVYVDDQLAAIGDLLACEPFGTGAERGVVRLRWNRPPYLDLRN